MNETSQALFARYQAGDDDAARLIFDRYTDRLVALAQSRLSKPMKRRVEAEDVVLSAYRSFFRKAQTHYHIAESGELWRLLAAITVSKVRGQVELHTAKKRGVYLEQSVSGTESCVVPVEAVVDEPTPEEAASILDEVTEVMGELSDTQRDILTLALQNWTVEQISKELSRSHRTVRRMLQSVRETLEKRLLQSC